MNKRGAKNDMKVSRASRSNLSQTTLYTQSEIMATVRLPQDFLWGFATARYATAQALHIRID